MEREDREDLEAEAADVLFCFLENLEDTVLARYPALDRAWFVETVETWAVNSSAAFHTAKKGKRHAR